MNNIFEREEPTQEEQNHCAKIIEQAKSHKGNNNELGKIFKREWSNIIKLHNDRKLCVHHFTPCTKIVSLSSDKQLFIIYQQFVNRWNSGDLSSNDYNIITNYVDKFY